jgi:hypothetical protein
VIEELRDTWFDTFDDLERPHTWRFKSALKEECGRRLTAGQRVAAVKAHQETVTRAAAKRLASLEEDKLVVEQLFDMGKGKAKLPPEGKPISDGGPEKPP